MKWGSKDFSVAVKNDSGQYNNKYTPCENTCYLYKIYRQKPALVTYIITCAYNILIIRSQMETKGKGMKEV